MQHPGAESEDQLHRCVRFPGGPGPGTTARREVCSRPRVAGPGGAACSGLGLGRPLRLHLALLAPAVGDAQLCRAGDPDRQDQKRSGQGGTEKCHRDWNVSRGREELNPNRPGVLHDEVDERNAQDGRHDHRHPGIADTGVVDTIASLLPAAPPPSTRLAFRRTYGRLTVGIELGCFSRGHNPILTHLNRDYNDVPAPTRDWLQRNGSIDEPSGYSEGVSPPLEPASPAERSKPVRSKPVRGEPVRGVEAVRALARASRVLERASGELSLAHYRVLSAIASGDERASRVAERLAIGKPTVSAAVDALAQRELLRRSGVDGDQRVAALHLTPEGEALLSRVEAEMIRRIEDLCARTPDGPQLMESLAWLGQAIDQVQAQRAAERRGL
jgi:DNA-binding MarR family transcriptional regulator